MKFQVEKQHHIRSFVRRESRMTDRQEKAIKSLWEKYGLSPEVVFQPTAVFSSDLPVVLEIGFGMGQSLLEMAKNNPEKNYVGVEVHRPGVGALMSKLEENGLNNIRVYSVDVVPLLKEKFLPDTFSEILIYFPDPWPKKRHHKRRLIQPEFVKMLLDVLKEGGVLHCATDWEDYAFEMMDALSSFQALVNTQGERQFASRPHWRPETKFERRGETLGHTIYDLIFQKRVIHV